MSFSRKRDSFLENDIATSYGFTRSRECGKIFQVNSLFVCRLSVGRGSTGGGAVPSGSGRLLRVITAACLILSAIFYTLLLAVPYTERHEVKTVYLYVMSWNLFDFSLVDRYVTQTLCGQDRSTKLVIAINP